STLFLGEILFIIFSPTDKPYSFGHPSVESIAKHFSNASQPLNETTDAPVETYRKGALQTNQRFEKFFNLISIKTDKKIAAISSMHAPMDKDVLSTFPSRYGPNMQQ
ncbi:hypothetical protein Goari_022814, partial [Gossypium aridum]|nr:hypothetical protein [Gossypium aridum]